MEAEQRKSYAGLSFCSCSLGYCNIDKSYLQPGLRGLQTSMKENSGWGSTFHPQEGTGQSRGTPDLTENYVACSWPTHYSPIVDYWFFLFRTPYLTKEERIFTEHTVAHTVQHLLCAWSPENKLSVSVGPDLAWASTQSLNWGAGLYLYSSYYILSGKRLDYDAKMSQGTLGRQGPMYLKNWRVGDHMSIPFDDIAFSAQDPRFRQG